MFDDIGERDTTHRPVRSPIGSKAFDLDEALGIGETGHSHCFG
jgi:hypothetical protein